MNHAAKHAIRFLAVAHVILLCGFMGCDPGHPTPTPLGPVPTFVGKTVCKEWIADDTPPDRECLVWSYDREARVLTVSHENACLNCCPQTTPYANYDDGVITLVEAEVGGDCDCYCLADLPYEIANLWPAKLRLVVDGACEGPGSPAVGGVIDLEHESAGTICVDRLEYPWRKPPPP